jgi:Helix-turn-helix domain
MTSTWQYKGDMGDTEENTAFCTIRDAARLSGLAEKTWYEGKAGTHIVPRVRFGRSVRLRCKDVEQFIQGRIHEAEKQVFNTNSVKPG